MDLRALIHLTKVAGAVSLQSQIVVLGSSSLLASFADLGEPGNLLVPTYDADLLIAEMDDRSAKALGEIIGEDSQFREHFGYYADLLRLAITDVLPPGWEERLVPLQECAGVFCLEPHDLAVAKLRAGRPKDLALLTALVSTGRLNAGTVRERLDQTPMPEAAIVITYRGLRQVEAACGLSGK